MVHLTPRTMDTEPHGANICEADWLVDYPEPWQLFVGGEMMVVARWPNAFWDNKSVFDDRKWVHGSKYSTYCGDELRDDVYRGPANWSTVLPPKSAI